MIKLGVGTMMNIRPVSDLRNKYPEIEKLVLEGEEVYLTKNGYGSMVVMSIEQYSKLKDSLEMKLDEADYMADNSTERLSHKQVFGKLKGKLNE
jgi:prevent-host-death family protein